MFRKYPIIIALVILLVSTVASAPREEYYSDRILICISPAYAKPDAAKLSVQLTDIPSVDNILKIMPVKSIESWIPAADDNDRDGEIMLDHILRICFDAGKASAEDLIYSLKSVSEILYAEPEPILRPDFIPNDPRYSSQWHLPQISADDAWGLWDISSGATPGSKEIIIGIVDSGVDYLHPDLKANLWVNQGEIPSAIFSSVDSDGDDFVTALEVESYLMSDYNGDGTINLQDALYTGSPFKNSLDDDGNGYKDDLLGWDASGNSGTADNDPMGSLSGAALLDYRMHGTHVAGIAGATTNNAAGIAGVAYDISIMAVKCSEDTDENGYISTGYSGMTYAAKSGAKIINMSWGGGSYSTSGQSTINSLRSIYGVVFVAAAGNGDDEGNEEYALHYPSSYNYVISVTALGTGDRWTHWASYHETVDIAAPGENILSTVFRTSTLGYASWMGTSMASPVVAGACALLWSMYPDQNAAWIENEILTTTDDIYTINNDPEYAGRLGSGRLNIYRALAHGIYPELSVGTLTYVFAEGDTDGDGVLNPGENARLRISIQNSTGFALAASVRATLSSDYDKIRITDNSAIYSDIPGGGMVTNISDLYEIFIDADAIPGSYPLTLHVEANQDSDYPYETHLDIPYTVSVMQYGFPVELVAAVESSPLVTDINGDGLTEIVLADLNGNVTVYNNDGSQQEGFSFSAGNKITGAPAAADIDLDGALEIVVTSYNKNIYCLNNDGSVQWSYETANLINGSAAIGNLDDDPEWEIVVGSGDSKVYAFKHDGTLLAGFPVSVGTGIVSGPAVADIDQSGKDDIIIPTYSTSLVALAEDGSTLRGWPAILAGKINCEPTILDIDGDASLEIAIGDDGGGMTVLNADGTQRFQVIDAGDIKASPAVISLNKGGYGLVFTSTSGYVHVLDNEGIEQAGWPKTIAPIYGSAIIFDVNGDALMDIIVLANSGTLYAWDQQGEIISGFPVATGEITKSSPVLCDLDGDEDYELVWGSDTKLMAIDLKNVENPVTDWPMHRYDMRRSGYFHGLFTSVVAPVVPEIFTLYGNYPNPFNPVTTLHFTIPVKGTVFLDVFNITGQIVSSSSMQLSEGDQNILWEGGSQPSGLYFYRLTWENISQNGKMVLIK